ncbi:dihydroneopterin aldolase [Aerococcus sp. UMB7834]|uniref:dihydroneopterin aldolase n=1 Tax=Aerococcus sp. UMB7834 TaxID=3046342 RepID=UPI002550303C|nr:dihydroneopterin aldolase [Aerococcus sp. UMB7834]MDK6805064.1 dihydroneopterin aldolase [Aerococcus sp. UMB7834]
MKEDCIYLNGLNFYAYHGLFPEETKLGQRFIVDLALYLDLTRAGQTDQMTDSAHYGEVYDSVKRVVEGEPFKLIERLAQAIADEILASQDLVDALQVKVTKPDPPIPGHYDSVAVEIYRERH